MKLTKQETLNILEELKKKTDNPKWIEHSICVGNAAGIIAQALNEKGMAVDVEKAIVLGYIHDIGKSQKRNFSHTIEGYNYLKSLGVDEEYCNICLTHSFLNNDLHCTAAGIPDKKANPELTDFISKHAYTIEEKIINLCDLMIPQGSKIVTIDARLIDIILRKGAYSNTQYHVKETYKLKEYFDNLLGYNLYDLFPEIKENI